MSDERQIPVFTVLKNNSILKNIFLMIKNQDINHDKGENCPEFEETLVVGRHPDCDIRLEHPSISRFHLKIHSLPSSKLLFVTDLSSVHGTWVSDRRIEPNARTIVKEGDDLRIGGSSRVYKLHWIPVSQAYDVSKPFVPPLDFLPQQDDEDEIIKDEVLVGMKDEEVHISDGISKAVESLDLGDDDQMVGQTVFSNAKPASGIDKAIELADSSFEGLESLDLGAISQEVECGQKEILLDPLILNEDLEYEDIQSVDSILEGLVPLFMGENWEWCPTEPDHAESSKDTFFLYDNSELSAPRSHEATAENMDCIKSEERQQVGMEHYPGLLTPVLEGLDTLFVDENSEISAPLMPEDMEFAAGENIDNLDSEDLSHSVNNDKTGLVGSPILKGLDIFSLDENSDLSATLVLNEMEFPEAENMDDVGKQGFLPESLGEVTADNGWGIWCESEVFSCRESSGEENQEGKLWSFWSGKMGIESSVCSAFSDADSFSETGNKSVKNGYVSSSLSSLITSKLKSDVEFFSESEKESGGDGYQSPESISSVKGMLGSPLMNSDQNPVDSIWLRQGKLATRLNFTPDKENATPVTRKPIRKSAALEDISNSRSRKSPLLKIRNYSPDKLCDDFLSPNYNKENFSPSTNQKNKAGMRASGSANRVHSVKLKERKRVRMPFDSLLADSPQKSITETKIKLQGKCKKLQQWNIVVDISTLLNKESRKALQLLEGLKGTRLVIPRIVITELTSLKRQVSFFRSNSEVLLALEWIQDCKLRTGWWVHVQSSMEDGTPVILTPSESAHFQFRCGIIGSFAFSWFEAQKEVVSPTVEDGVLDFAVEFKKSNSDGELVLLSNDVRMKIKAMAKGVICETGEEFRASLVNPFVERFRWTDSAPRGQTWSCADDFVLKTTFYPSSLKMMTPKSIGNVKGLKLILSAVWVL